MEWIDIILVALLLVVVIDSNVRRVQRKRAWLAANVDGTLPPPEFKTGRATAVIVLMTAVFALAWWWTGRPWLALGLGWTGGWWGWTGLGIAVGYIVLIRGMMQGLLRTARTDPEERALAIKLVRSLRERQFGIPMKTYYVMLGGVWEEIMFRGYLFWLLSQYLSAWPTFIACALLFGLSHGSQGIQAVATTSGIGAILTALRVMTGNMPIAAVVHALHNASVASLVLQVEKLAESMPPASDEGDAAAED